MKNNSNLLIEKRNSEVFLRPRFTIDLNVNKETVLQLFANAFEEGSPKIVGNIVDGHIFLAIHKKDDHFWSPQLHLEVVEKTATTSLLKGLFGPKPQVWTLFMFIHFVIGFTFLVFGILLYTRLSLNESIFFPILMMIVLPLVWVLFYFLGRVGKSSGKHQIKILHNCMIDVLAS